MLYLGKNRLVNINSGGGGGTEALEEEIAAIKTDIEGVKDSVSTVDSKADGKTRTIVFDTFLDFFNFISEFGTIIVNGNDFTPSNLQNGDIARILEDGVPDFWYESDYWGDVGSTYEYNGEEYNLTVWSIHQMEVIGRMHPAKGTSADPVDLEALGDIDAALDAILEIQNALMESAKEDETVFTFYIDDVECTAEVGMTWGQWIESDYNTIGVRLFDEDNPVVVLNGKTVGGRLGYQSLMEAYRIEEFRYFTY